MNFEITAFENAKHRDQVIALWKDVFNYETPHNSPDIAIDKTEKRISMGKRLLQNIQTANNVL
jgi:hypothetical protein